MNILTGNYYSRTLEQYRTSIVPGSMETITSGYWDESPYHSGYIAYEFGRLADGGWVLDAVSRNAMLDHLTEEDVEEGRLNDDQIQLLMYKTLEEAQNQEYCEIVAVCLEPDPGLPAAEIGRALYHAALGGGCPRVTDPD
jgi:hypothetical protein